MIGVLSHARRAGPRSASAAPPSPRARSRCGSWCVVALERRLGGSFEHAIQGLATASPLLHDTVGMHVHGVGSFHGISYNPYAAMPSLHVGWSMIVAGGVFRAVRSIWLRVAAIVHSFAMALATIATGNHYLLDCVAGSCVAAVAMLAAPSPRTARASPRARARVAAPVRAT